MVTDKCDECKFVVINKLYNKKYFMFIYYYQLPIDIRIETK